MDVRSPEFVNSLWERIEAVRSSVKINEPNEISGIRFKDTFLVVEAIQGSLLVLGNPDLKDKVIPQAVGLLPHKSDVLTGQFDPLIRFVLSEYAKMDFESENSVDLH